MFGGAWFDSPVAYFEAAHSVLHTTRGAALAFAQVDRYRRNLRYAGIGNISGSLTGASHNKGRSLLSYNGIVGTAVRKLQQFDHQWIDGELLIMHSDGLTDRWQLNAYPGLLRADTAIIAGVLYRDARRGRDDATIVVARLQAT